MHEYISGVKEGRGGHEDWQSIFTVDPTACLQIIEDTLAVRVGYAVGAQKYHPEDPEFEERRYRSRIGPKTYETIRSFERMASFLSRHGCLKPEQLGLWLTEESIVLNGATPEGHLLCNLREDGSFREATTEDVIVAAEPFLNPFSFEGDVMETWREHNR